MVRNILIIILSGILILAACQNDRAGKKIQNIPLSNYDPGLSQVAVIRFDTTTYNFGKVYEGEKVGAYFKYKNLGNKNLVLTNVTASCGCTIPDYSIEPIAPGMEGEIKVVFNTDGRTGHQYKSVSVETNGEPEEIELYIIAEVIGK